jgi:CRISPR/Cas system CMR-associated protein Cmr5 small subunit
MIEKNIKTMIPLAMEIINESKIYSKDKGIQKKYHGYISSFLPSASQSTLLKVLEFYEIKDANSERRKMLPILFETLKKANFLDNGNESRSLLEITRTNKEDPNAYRIWKNRVAEAVIACKFAMRTFNEIPNEEDREKT